MKYPKLIDTVKRGRFTYEIYKRRPQHIYRFVVCAVDHEDGDTGTYLNDFKTEKEAREYIGKTDNYIHQDSKTDHEKDSWKWRFFVLGLYFGTVIVVIVLILKLAGVI